MKLDRIKRAASLILCALMLSSDMALCIQAAAEEITDIAAGTAEATVSAIGKTAEFSGSYPVTIAPAPLTAANLEGFTEAQLQAEDIPAGALFYITDEAESAVNGSVWYKLDATPDTQMPAKLAANPWVLFGYATGETTSALYVHDGGKNYVFNDRGEIVTSIEMEQKTAADPYNDVTLYGASTLFGQVAYKWQISRPEDGGVWVDLYGENSSVLTVRESMLTVGETVLLRSVSTVDGKTALSDPVAVTLKEAVAPIVPTEILPGFVMMSAAPEPGEDYYSIIINYVFEGGEEAAHAWTVSLKKGHPYYSLNVMSPQIVGYKPDQAFITDTITNIDKNHTYTVTYVPDTVHYTVNHWFQNTDNDNYSYNPAFPSETREGLTGTVVPGTLNLTHDLNDNYSVDKSKLAGFYSLIYDTTLTLAADGTTVVNIYYDRRYFKIDLDLDGGYDAEPVFARYGTVIDQSSFVPKKMGYTFNKWVLVEGYSAEVPGTMPAYDSKYKATYTPANATYTIAFWYENADNDNFTYVGSSKRTGTTGTAVSGSINDYNNATTAEIPGKDTKNFYELKSADQNVEIKADGSTVVNVRIKRRTYTLTYKEFVCPHTVNKHGTECCTLQHAAHAITCCTKTQHASHNETLGQCCDVHIHKKSCIKNSLSVTTDGNAEKADAKCPNPYQGQTCEVDGFLWSTYYLVYFNDDWYQDSSNMTKKLTWNCSLPAHTHGSGCNGNACPYGGTHNHSSGWNSTCNVSSCPYGGTLHDHSSGRLGSCNSANCTHLGKVYAGCGCWGTSAQTTASNWKVVNKYEVKYEQSVGQYHKDNMTTGGHLFVPEKNDFYVSINFNYGPYGNGTGVGAFSSMPACDVTFNRKRTGGNEYYMTFMLESLDGTGTSYTSRGATTSSDNGKTFVFKTGTQFFCKMGGVGYKDEFVSGCPAGFRLLEATYGPQSNPNQFVLATETGSNPNYSYNNFYYLRKVYKLQYHANFEGGLTKTVDMKFEQPLTGSFDVTPKSLGFSHPNAGYEFKGWYLDAACNVPADFNGSLIMPNAGVEGSIGLALYAKWGYKNHEVKVRDAENGNITSYFDPIHGTVITNAPSAPVIQDMQFIGWFYKDAETGDERAFDFTMAVYKNLDLYPRYVSTKMTKVFVYYKVEGTDIDVADFTDTSGLIGTTKTFEAKTGDALFTGFTEGYFPNLKSHNVKFESTEAVTYTFWYTQKAAVNYKVVHHVDNGDGTEQIREDTYSSASASVVVYRDSETLKDYVADAVSKKLILSSDESLNVVHFYYEKPSVDDPSVTVSVQIVHQTENIANSNYTEVASYPTSYIELMKGETRVISEGIMYIPGFTFSVSESERLSSPAGSAFVYDTGANTFGAQLTYLGLELVLCYKRNEYPYEFRFVDQGGNTLLPPVTGYAKYQSSVSYEAAQSIPGYRLYSDAVQKITIDIEDGSNAVKNVITFSYMEDKVKLEYVAQPGGTVSPPSEEIYAKTGTAQGSTVTSVDPNYEFDGWYNSVGTQVETDYYFCPTKDGDSYTAEKYTARFRKKQATIYYQTVGVGGSLTSYSEVVDILTGETVGSTANAQDGYKFAGWYRDEECTDLISNLSNFIQPSKQVGEAWVDGTTYYAKFEEQQVTITYTATEGGTVTSAGETVKVVSQTVRGSVAQANAGYVFIGWYRDGARVTADPAIHPEKESATYEARFTELLSTISYVVKGPVDGCGTVTPSAETLNQINASAVGSTAKAESNLYKFVGWFDNESCNGTPITENATFIPTKTGEAWPESVTYYAKFEYNLTSLTVTKSGAETVDENQTFLFEITDSDGLAVRFTIHGNGSVVISGLTVGKTYTVTEITEWSWRYSNDSSSKDITLEASGNTLTFVNTRKESKWLDGDSWSQHILNDGEG